MAFNVGDIIYSNREPEHRYEVVGFEEDEHAETQDQMLIRRTDHSDGPVTGIPRYRWDFWRASE